MIYKNISTFRKTFHGVTFNPGEIKSVPGYINDMSFIRVSSLPKEPPQGNEKANKKISKPEKKPQAKPSENKKVESSKKKEEKLEEPKKVEEVKETEKIKEEKLDGTDSNQ